MAKHKHTENQPTKQAQRQANAKGAKRAPQQPRMGTNSYNQFR